MHRLASALAACFVLAAFAAGSASAQSIREARARWLDADFTSARRAFDAVLARRDLTMPEAAEAHRYLAVLHLVLRDPSAAAEHADAAVALDLEVEPPEGSPASASALFADARARVGDVEARLTIAPSGSFAAGTPATIEARLDPAPRALVSHLRLRCDGLEAIARGPSVELEVTPIGTVGCTVDALTEGGAVVLTLHRELAADADRATQGRPVWPWVIGGSAAAVVIAVAVGVAASGPGDARFGTTTVVGW